MFNIKCLIFCLINKENVWGGLKMIVLIDGYNLLRQVFPKLRGKLDKQRKLFVKQLGIYKRIRSEGIAEIIVVFDGGLFGHASREVSGGIVVIFSGQKSSADEWIINYTQKHKGKELLLVSLDRKLKDSVKIFGCDSVDVFDFYNIVKRTVRDNDENKFSSSELYGELIKYDDGDSYLDSKFEGLDNEDLDLLMDESTLNFKDGKKDIYSDETFKGKRKKVSKKVRKLMSKLKKL